jgi:protein-S-isoprenylcysteine O-methyltransferase Ste14
VSGTPAPVAPTEQLVVGGLYRYVRNPMYLAVAATIAGQALLLGRPVLLALGADLPRHHSSLCALLRGAGVRQRYGTQYEAYCAAVPGWWPRVRR